MKKLILTILAVMMLLLSVLAEGETDDGCLNLDFTASYSEDKADMLGVRVKDGFHVSVIKGKLSPISSFGIPITFVLEDERVKDYDYAVFNLKCGYVDEKSVITVRYKASDGSVTEENIAIADNKFNLYCVKFPEREISGFDIFVNSIEPTQDMYAVDLDYIKLYKSAPVLITIDSTKAYVGNEAKNLDSPALIRDNFTLTPARFVAESVGAKVDWIGSERKVIITKDDITIELVIDNNVAKVNGKEVELDAPPCIINDFTYTPARFIAENLGCDVQWDAEHRIVFVY